MAIEIGQFKGGWDELVELLDLAFAAPWTETQLEAERRVWEADRSTVATDDGQLVDLIVEIAPDERTRHALLVDNPQRLYRFSASTHRE